MERKEFIRSSCIACMGMVVGASLLESCFSLKPAAVKMTDNGLVVNLEEFYPSIKGERPYVVVRHEDLQFPICVYRIDKDTFSAVLMKCSHQGAELQVAGDQLTCSAHGSEFDKWGKVMQGPASVQLRTFPVTVANGQLFIDMRKQS